MAPPPVYEAPGRARFPLYADDTASRIPLPEPGSAEGSGYDTPAWLARTPEGAQRRRRSPLLPWIVAGVTVLIAAGLGATLLLRGGGDDSAVDHGGGGPRGGRHSTPAAPSSAPVTTGTTEVPTTPDSPGTPSTGPSTGPAPGASRDLDDLATAGVPDHAPDGVDVDGDPVSYGAANLLDGDPSTAWRTVGDGTGETITITFARPVTLTSIGLINGYAKSEPGYDGYAANRRVTEVTWTFGDGAAVDQTLTQTRGMQSIGVSGPATRFVTLRIDGVTAPGRGTSGRDYTAISELRLEGSSG